MDSTLMAFLFSAGAVVLAEMGDKTQLLAMAFATKYKASKVMIGVFLATVLNHALAVAVGNYITTFETGQAWVQGIASLSFIFLGLWTIRGDKLEGEENRTTSYGAIATVAIAFFIAEMGDKTPLATISLAAKFPADPIGILMGTTTGMLIADAVGIVIGVVMCKRIPEKTIKLVSAIVFILFGFIGTYQVALEKLNLQTPLLVMEMLGLVTVTGIAVYYLMKNNGNEGKENPVVVNYCNLEQKKNTYKWS